MSEPEILTNHVKVANGDLQIAAYLAQPVGEGPFPGVVVFQEIFGVNEHIRDVTERVAKQGYVAIAPAIYQRTAPDFEVGYTEKDLEIGRYHKDKTTADQLLSDTQATINYLKSLPNTTDAFGCMGFCFGGHVAYLAATLPEMKATGSFYGAGVATMTPGGGDPTITRTSEINGTIYLFFGNEDPLIPNEQGDRIEAELQKQQVSHRVFRYDGTDHGFFCDRRGSYNPTAAADAWNHVLQLFGETLKTN
jgi:carboxymethylenebutenolidase